MTLRKKLDKYLVNLAWSLWTELGVAGIKRDHQQWLIAPEELILLTAVIAEEDPRLRDEALDWCTRYHQYISTSRLRMLAKIFGPSVNKPFSVFAATLNSVSRAKWPILESEHPIKFVPSGKSKLPQFKLPALICFRLRALFGVGARADLMMFLLIKGKGDIAAADATEIGYAKRNLADVLDNLTLSGVLESFMSRNQRRYRFAKREQMLELLGSLPQFMPPWWLIFEVILKLRYSIKEVEEKSESTRVVEIRNTLGALKDKLRQLHFEPPPMQSNFQAYWDSFDDWILGIIKSFHTS